MSMTELILLGVLALFVVLMSRREDRTNAGRRTSSTPRTPTTALGGWGSAAMRSGMVRFIPYLAAFAALYYFFPVDAVWTWLKATLPAESWLQDPRTLWGVWVAAGLLALLVVSLLQRMLFGGTSTMRLPTISSARTSEAFALVVPILVFGIVVFLVPEVLGPFVTSHWRWLVVAYILFLLLVWSYRDTTSSIRRSRIFGLVTIVAVLVLAVGLSKCVGDTKEGVTPTTPSVAKVSEACPGERDAFVSQWKSCIMDANSPPLKIRVPKETNPEFPTYSIGVTPVGAELGGCIIPSTTCGDLTVWYSVKGEPVDWPLSDITRGPQQYRSLAFTGAKTPDCEVTYKVLKPGQHCE